MMDKGRRSTGRRDSGHSSELMPATHSILQSKVVKSPRNITREAGGRSSTCIALVPLPKSESESLAEAVREHLVFLAPGASAASEVGRTLAQIISSKLDKYAPTLARHIERARNAKVDAIYVTGLPNEADIIPMVAVVLAYALGFGALKDRTENGCELLMIARPERSAKFGDTATNAAAGAVGSHELVPTPLQLVSADGIFISPDIRPGEKFSASAPTTPKEYRRKIPNAAAEMGLTERRLEVLFLMMQGEGNKSIARTLDLAIQTVKNHVTTVLRAFKVPTRAKAVIAANKLGWDLSAIAKRLSQAVMAIMPASIDVCDEYLGMLV